MKRVEDLRIRIFADCADIDSVVAMAAHPLVKGFTTNPTLMRKAGYSSYVSVARMILDQIGDKPVSFEVIADDFAGMIRQGRRLAGFGSNVYVKIPVTDTKGNFTGPVLAALSAEAVKLNVTAIFTAVQCRQAVDALVWGYEGYNDCHVILSIFAGRIADTGIDPAPLMGELARRYGLGVLWASPRELLNVFQADEAGCDIITLSPDLIAKLTLVGKDLTEYSRETVQMFHRDAMAARYVL